MIACTTDCNIAIHGGGLAGPTLSRKILMQRSETQVTVIEKGESPVVESICKVGESTVEIGAH